jgi:hypothetical protein
MSPCSELRSEPLDWLNRQRTPRANSRPMHRQYKVTTSWSRFTITILDCGLLFTEATNKAGLKFYNTAEFSLLRLPSCIYTGLMHATHSSCPADPSSYKFSILETQLFVQRSSVSPFSKRGSLQVQYGLRQNHG